MIDKFKDFKRKSIHGEWSIFRETNTSRNIYKLSKGYTSRISEKTTMYMWLMTMNRCLDISSSVRKLHLLDKNFLIFFINPK